MSQPIVFYDIPGNAAKDAAWSPNTWKTRYCLNIKQIPYQTVWVEYPDIAALCKKIGATPTSTKSDGTPQYTLPTIYDPNTNTAVSESAAIARYLDKTYPSAVPVIPKGTDAFHEAFTYAFQGVFITPLLQICLLPTCQQLNPKSEAYFRRTREAAYGMKMEEFAPAGSEKRAMHWKSVEGGLHLFKAWLGADGTEKQFFMGDKISYADITIASFLEWLKRVCGEDSQEWKDVMGWDGGFWTKFMNELGQYSRVDAGSQFQA